MICYPYLRKKISCSISDITGRRTARKTDNSPSSFGLVGYAASGGQGNTFFSITYIIGGKDIITIHTGMKNAQRLDSVIVSHLSPEEEKAQ